MEQIIEEIKELQKKYDQAKQSKAACLENIENLQKNIEPTERKINEYDIEISRLEGKISNNKTILQSMPAKIKDAKEASAKAESTAPNYSGCDYMIGSERTRCINTRKAENKGAKETARKKLADLEKEKENLENTISTSENELQTSKDDRTLQKTLEDGLKELSSLIELTKTLEADISNKHEQYQNQKLKEQAKSILFADDLDINDKCDVIDNQEDDTTGDIIDNIVVAGDIRHTEQDDTVEG